MSHVTHTTALALKAAGLPQPKPAPDQVWYFDTGKRSYQYLDFPKLAVEKLLYFAPDADYIIKHFAEKEMGDMAVSYSAAGAEFISFDPAMEENWRGIGSGENMAEAAAALFLERVKTPV